MVSEEESIYIQHAENEGEYRIPKTRYKVDGYCKETNTVYEFHGDIFHGNPNIFQPGEFCNYYNKKVTAGELYHKTMEREKVIKDLRYNLITIWEQDYNKIIKDKKLLQPI